MIVAFTGHRPDKLGGYKLPNPTYVKVCQQIETKLVELKPEKIISGMALGVGGKDKIQSSSNLIKNSI